MSSNTLSAVLERQIQRLCLNDFPCGNGQWRQMESTDVLLDLLNCPQSPWWKDESWSAQTSSLRQLAVLTPERLNPDFIHSYFTSLRIVDKDVSSIDDGLLKFSKLKELVLSGNVISEIHTEHLPKTLKNLDLRANRLSSLNTLTNRPPHDLQYLALSSNSLGSHQDISHLTGKHWPQLVSLDLGDCEFHDQKTLLKALSSLPCLKTLVLEGNPFTLSPSYPGFTVDSLPQLICLDASWVSTEKRKSFRGMAKMKGLIVDMATATVSVGRIRGIPDPMTMDENAYFVIYEFPSHQKPVNLVLDSESESDAAPAAHVAEHSSSDADLQSSEARESEATKPKAEVSTAVDTEEPFRDVARVSKHSTAKVTWSECMDISDTQTHTVSSLGCFKKFLNQGLCLWLEEEQVVPGAAASEDVSGAKPGRTVKEKKGGKKSEAAAKSGTTKDKTKDKKTKSAPTPVQDAPIRRILGSIHVPLQSLVRGGRRVDIVCDFGVLHTDSEDLGKKIKEDKKEESKETRGSSRGQKNTAPSKGKGKGKKEPEVDAHADKSPSVHLEPVTVELSVELEKWQSASEAHELQLPHRTP
ncbi:leucine-rich repeat-containing protein 43-like [Mugil cephalus]|uniref:leucine-rich repeat-containing protein 43-like n=1 Tax=Mugil cephalus TaxID=48193 RepID=UPI001FB6D212|nr:leucine-rich repeat-containing protein 43-like [Mugil cephalus]